MKSGLAFILVLAFAGFLRAATVENVPQADLSFRGVVLVKPAEAGIGDPIVVQVRDLDGWVLDQIKQKRITGEGYFTDDQFEEFLARHLKAQADGAEQGKDIQYGDLLTNESEAIDECVNYIQRLKVVIGMFQEYIDLISPTEGSSAASTTGQASADAEKAVTDLQAAEKELATVGTSFANRESEWSNGPDALFRFKPRVVPAAGASTTGTAAAAAGQPSEEVERAREGLDAAQKELAVVTAVFTEIESTWYSGWQAYQCWKALFRAVRENLYLVLNDSRLVHVKAQNPFNEAYQDATDTSTYKFIFDLEKDPDDKEEWDKLYQGTRRHIPVTLTLAFVLAGKTYTLDTRVQPPLPGESAPVQPAQEGFSQEFTFVTYQISSMATGLGIVILALLVFIWFADATEMLRDPSPATHECLTFSLARCQTAFWFFLFTAAFVLLWVVKDQTDTLTDQCLVLLGISTGATIGSALITDPVQSRAYGKKLPPTTLKQFFNDLLSDAAGQIVFYRFQTLIWTLALGLVFIKSVYSGLRMPEFSTNELTLMGISAGTYVGFKIPEAKAAKDAAAALVSPPSATAEQAPPADEPEADEKHS
jgi:hypothetical protein